MANVTIKNQSLGMKLWMFFFSSVFAAICVQIIALFQEGEWEYFNEAKGSVTKLAGFLLRALSAHEVAQPLAYYACSIVGALIVLLVVYFRNEIISRYLLACNIYIIATSLGKLFVGDSLVGLWNYVFATILLSVFVYTMLYTESGFIGKEFKKRSTMIEASCFLFGALVIAFVLKRGETILLFELILSRFLILHIYDEEKKTTKIERVQRLLIAAAAWGLILYGLPFLVQKMIPENHTFGHDSIPAREI